MDDELPPGTRSANAFFKQATPISIKAMTAPLHTDPRSDLEARRYCMNCLERFDPETQKPRSIWERGQLRTRLKMSDQGYELPVCDACWDGIALTPYMQGFAQPVQADPNVIPNPLLRKTESS